MATWLNCYYYFNQQASQSPPLLTLESTLFGIFSNFMQLLPMQVCKVSAVVFLRWLVTVLKIKITILKEYISN